MIAAMPILDPRVWVEAFNGVPVVYKGVVLGIVALFVAFRWWPGRRRNGD